eukprot:289061_1
MAVSEHLVPIIEQIPVLPSQNAIHPDKSCGTIQHIPATIMIPVRLPSTRSKLKWNFISTDILGSTFTMCISIVNVGCLTLPYAFRNVGLIFGIPLLLFGAILAYFTLDLLLISAEYLPEQLRGPKPYRNISYQTLA